MGFNSGFKGLITEPFLHVGMYGMRITGSHLGCDAASYGKWFFTFQRKTKATHSLTVLGSTHRVIQQLVPNDQSRMSSRCKSIKTHICGIYTICTANVKQKVIEPLLKGENFYLQFWWSARALLVKQQLLSQIC